MAELAPLLSIAREAVALARRIVLERVPVSVCAKGDRDLVTDVDVAVEEAVRGFLGRETPEIGMLGEEHGRTGPVGPRFWVLDPVDGTANFARGIPLCGVSLGLVDGDSAVVAALDFPFLRTEYAAFAGGGAYAGQERISVSQAQRIDEVIVSIGDFATGEGAERNNRARLALLADLGARAQRIRMLGTAAADLAWVADGKLDATVILANLPWDTVAGVLLVREAGGLVHDSDGSDHTISSSATIAAAPGVATEILTAVQGAINVRP